MALRPCCGASGQRHLLAAASNLFNLDYFFFQSFINSIPSRVPYLSSRQGNSVSCLLRSPFSSSVQRLGRVLGPCAAQSLFSHPPCGCPRAPTGSCSLKRAQGPPAPDGYVLPSPGLISGCRCGVVLPVQYLKIVSYMVLVHNRIIQYQCTTLASIVHYWLQYRKGLNCRYHVLYNEATG